MRKLKILVTDDSKPSRVMISTILENKQVEITEAAEGSEALEYVLQSSFDLILMDQNMPIMTGLEFVKVLKKYKKMTPIIMITAVSKKETVKETLANGVCDYILKPFKAETMIKKIEDVLETQGKKLLDK